MKIHALISAKENTVPAFRRAGDVQVPALFNGISLQAEAGCIARCVGTTAATRCAYCGSDPTCWESCAGAGRGSCVSQCFI